MVDIINNIQSRILENEPKIRNFLDKTKLKVDYLDYPKLVREGQSGFDMLGIATGTSLDTAINAWTRAEEEWADSNKNASTGITDDVFYKIISNFYRPCLKAMFDAFANQSFAVEGYMNLNATALSLIRDFESMKVQSTQLGLVKDIGAERANDLKDILTKLIDVKQSDGSKEDQMLIQRLNQTVALQDQKINSLTQMLENFMRMQSQKIYKETEQLKPVQTPSNYGVEVWKSEKKNNKIQTDEEPNEDEQSNKDSPSDEVILNKIREEPNKGVKTYVKEFKKQGYDPDSTFEKIKNMVISGVIKSRPAFGGRNKSLYLDENQ